MRTTTNYNLKIPELADKVKESITAYGTNFSSLDEIIHDITGLNFSIVSILPSTGENGVIYLVPASTTTTRNIYDEFIWVNSQFEQIGTTAIDLSNYYNKTQVDNLLAGIGDGIKEITDTSIIIWNLNEGVYKINYDAETMLNIKIYYKGSTGTSYFRIYSNAYLFVFNNAAGYKMWFLVYGDASITRYIASGYTDDSSGDYKSYSLNSSYLTNISSYVKNDLTYSTSDTTYALSAYQGYLLNQNKQDKLTAGDNISISNNVIDTVGDTIKVINDNSIRIWWMDAGKYILKNKCVVMFEGDAGSRTFTVGAGSLLDIVFDYDQTENINYKDYMVLNTSGSSLEVKYGTSSASTGSVYSFTLDNIQTADNLATSISSSSSNRQAPSAKAVYDFVGENSDIPQGSIVQYDGDTIPTGYEEVNGFDNYSTTEQVVGTWIDGKPIYQKVIPLTGLPSTAGTAKDFDTGYNRAQIYPLKCESILNSNTWGGYYGNFVAINSTTPSQSSYVSVSFAVNTAGANIQVRVRSSYDLSAYSGYAIIQYTKTTD